MDCDICHRNHDARRLPFLCTVDARNAIFEGRMENVQLLIKNEGLQQEINDLLNETSTPSKDRKESLQAQQRTAEDRTSQILAAADKLRSDIKAAREEIQARKAALSRRKADIASVSDGLVERRIRRQQDVEKEIGMSRYKWSRGADDMARTRSFLCMEAARLYGLERVKEGSSGKYEYYLGGIPVVDLTGMNSSTPEMISTSLSHVCHILMLVSHYLSIRLPAAITLPHRDYPRPTIFNLSASYRSGDPVFPSQSGLSTPSNPGDADSQRVSRPRPLYIDKPLPQLAKEDPATFSYFIEGVTLLAYNIAWACSTQGVPIGDKTYFEDICNMGRNLHNLLTNQQATGSSLLPATSTTRESEASKGEADGQVSRMGQYSHGTTFYYLGGAEGTDFSKTFKLPGPMKLADKLKKKLLSEAPTPDWEVLDDDAWKVEEEPANGNQPRKDMLAMDKNTPRSGWMRVKNR
ncbi:UV radiation resistance protein and autophagy-related subunit 14-domain-containing protein [Fusarium tricinctum]|uniref:Autophagy-related protein 14 n=1 Tax=Fusarium tricinctum TaxID=61284 RepID=A0A8K0S878_9HYPO|nr:UV radiation resistance protein and autophagy-related subunit 14-domain-containing protein [Fusarium tricinctum]